MKVQDIRIGNYLEYRDKFQQVIELNNDQSENQMISVKPIGDQIYNSTDFENVYPIPLTKEWLLKFGLTMIQWNPRGKKLNGYNIYINQKMEFHYEPEHGFYHEINHMIKGRYPIKHVHQLQNLYHALTGEELKEK